VYWLIVAIILGIVEGATEFIPVSSTGHLIVVSDWLGFVGETANTFVVFIQLGAILAIVWLYRLRLFGAVARWRTDPRARRFLLNIAIACIPASVAGLLLNKLIKAHLFNPLTVAGALIAGGIAILVIERWQPVTRVQDVDDIPPRLALGVGLAQTLALFPGVSRSGATIMGGFSLGLSRRAATEFSFFLAVPIMFAATLFDLYEGREMITRMEGRMFAVGFLVSFLTALVVVKAFVSFVSRHSFAGFAWYRIAFGTLVFGLYAARGW
jgi:undecaprenyl-diphosphatase